MSVKRGRGNEEEEKIAGVSEEKVFNKSKKILRSPEQRRILEEKEKREEEQQNINKTKPATQDQKKMDQETKKEIQNMMKYVLEEMKNEMIKKQEELMEELKEMRKEMKRKEEKWEEEREQLISRIEILENRQESEEREKKKNNIVVKGLSIENENENVKEKVEEFIKKEMKIETKLTKAMKINIGTKSEMILAQVESWEMKRKIMEGKSKLKGTKIYVDNDLTKNEREIQREIRNIVRETARAGDKVRIGYQKLAINEKEYKWSKKERGLVQINMNIKN